MMYHFIPESMNDKIICLIDGLCLPEQIKTNNNTIRNLTGEYGAYVRKNVK